MTAQESGPITFAGSGGTLLDDGAAAPSSAISGFDTTDRIILAGVAADPNATLTTSGDTATVSAGGQSYVLDIVGASAMPLTLGIGTTAGNIDIACFCAGTAIATLTGERPVETIGPGDLLVTARWAAACRGETFSCRQTTRSCWTACWCRRRRSWEALA